MQFDYEFEDENSDFSLDDEDDTSAISWQDLLGDDDDTNKDSDKSDNDKAQSISNFDISAIQDDILEQKSDDKISGVGAKEGVVSKSSADNLVQSVKSSDGVFSYDSEDSLMDETNDDNIKLNENEVSSVLDDELMSILSDKKEEEKEEAPVNTNDDYEEQNQETSAVQNIGHDAYPTGNEVDIEESEPDVNDNYQTEDIIPNSKKKSSKPMVFVALLMIFVAVVALLGYSFINNSVETNIDIENTPVTSDVSDEAPADNNVAITRKQAKEIEEKEKVENQDKATTTNTPKKVVVNVPLEGRRNPFVPSALFDDEGLLSIGADFSAIPDINPDDPEAVEARKLFEISVSGIMYDPVKPSAILKFDGKDYFVQKGDRIDTYVVHQITKDYVAIRNSANIYKAYVGESFAIESSNIPSSQQMKVKNGQRQYISSEDVKINVK